MEEPEDGGEDPAPKPLALSSKEFDAGAPPAADIADSFLPRTYTAPFSTYVESVARDVRRVFNDSALASLRPQIQEINRVLQNSSFQERMAQVLARLVPPDWDARTKAALEMFVDRVLPPNLHGIGTFRFKTLMELADEGITLYWVPGPRVARRLVAASTTKARRRILNDAAATILDDCDAVLDRCTAPATMTAVAYTRKAIAAARDGHTEAAQALAANTLDTMLVDTFGWHGSRQLTSHKAGAREELARTEVRYYLVVAPIHQVYQTFWTDRGDQVPSAFSRHASAHAVGPKQFTRRATVQAIMLNTSFIAWRNGL